MREAVRAKKRKIHEDAADRAAGQELLAKAGAHLTVDLPEAMLDRTADNEMRMLEQRLSRSNITLEKHFNFCAFFGPCWPPAPLPRPRTSP